MKKNIKEFSIFFQNKNVIFRRWEKCSLQLVKQTIKFDCNLTNDN